MHLLTAIPVYNEEDYLQPVLTEVLKHAGDVLVVDDGSTDRTPELLRTFPTVRTIRHPRNLGYGAGLRTAFRAAIEGGYDGLVTLDCDGQHEPSRIPELSARLRDADIVSGSRYLEVFDPSQRPPEERRRINVEVTRWLNECLGLNLTDAFCGFKAYRTTALERFDITDDGYAMPLQVWVQAAAHGMTIEEVAVPLIYLDESRAFGGALDDAELPAGPLPPGVPGGARSDRARHRGRVSGMTARRLRAPATDGGLLVEPPWGEVRGLAACQRRSALRLGLRRPGPPGCAAARPGPPRDRRSGPRVPPPPRPGRGPGRPRIARLAARPADRDRSSARAVPSGRLGQELRGVGDRPLVRGARAQPDRRQRYPQGLIHPRAGRSRRPASARSRSSSIDGRASSPTRTGKSATNRCSRLFPIACAESSATRSPTRCSTTSGRGRAGAAARSTRSACGSPWPAARSRPSGESPTSKSPWAGSARPTASSGSPRT